MKITEIWYCTEHTEAAQLTENGTVDMIHYHIIAVVGDAAVNVDFVKCAEEAEDPEHMIRASLDTLHSMVDDIPSDDAGKLCFPANQIQSRYPNAKKLP